MICLRCGCCCVNLDVAIINPSAVRPDGTLDPEHPLPMILKPKGEICPHLTLLEHKATCKIHELPCYRGTPCDQFELLGRENDVCVMKGYYNY
jgi:hypothetical protein